MVIYADLVFLLNGLIDFLLLWLTSGIRKQKVALWRLFVASGIGGLYSMLYLWPQWSWAYVFPMKIVISLLMVRIAFGRQQLLQFLRNLVVFYLICFLAGGTMIALHYGFSKDTQVAGGIFFSDAKGWGSPISWGFIVVGFPIVWLYTRFSLRSIEEHQKYEKYMTNIRIRFGERSKEVVGLIDTGNRLRDPVTRSPVILVEWSTICSLVPEEILDLVEDREWNEKLSHLPMEWMKRVRIIPYRAAGVDGELMLAIKPDEVQIIEGKHCHKVDKVLIGIDVGQLSADGTYQAIIHPSCVSVMHSGFH